VCLGPVRNTDIKIGKGDNFSTVYRVRGVLPRRMKEGGTREEGGGWEEGRGQEKGF